MTNSAASLSPIKLSAQAATARINSFLVELHGQRVAAMGVDQSGLYQHYKTLLDENRLADRPVASLANLIQRVLPKFASYHVLRAGLGELAFVLAALGLKVAAFEQDARRFGALEAGLAALRKIDPELAARVTVGRAMIPGVPRENDILGVATHLMGFSADEEEKAFTDLLRYKAILIEPRIFLHLRNTPDEQEAAIEALRLRAFPIIREFPGSGVVFGAKSAADATSSVIIERPEFPAVDRLVDVLERMPLYETGVHVMRPAAVSVRDFPFPFSSALAFTCGVEWITAAHFRGMRDYLCGTGETAFGTGLGLEIGGAFTLRSNDGLAGFGTPRPREATAGDDEAAIIELGRAGWIDTLRGIVIDDAARRKLDGLAKTGFVPRVGMDVTGQYSALRYISDDSLLECAKFGDHHDFRTEARYVEAIRFYDWEQWEAIFPATAETLTARFNSILQPGKAGQGWQLFKRFRGLLAPTWTCLPPQLTTEGFDALTAQRGAMIVEVETGVWSLIGAAERHECRRPLEDHEMFDLHAVECWKDIASRVHEKRLLVATAGRLLDWLSLRSRLALKTERNPDKWVVSLSWTDATGLEPLTPAHLEGLALSVPETAPEVVVQIEGMRSTPPFRRAPDPSLPQRHAVYWPWTSLVWPPERSR